MKLKYLMLATLVSFLPILAVMPLLSKGTGLHSELMVMGSSPSIWFDLPSWGQHFYAVERLTNFTANSPLLMVLVIQVLLMMLLVSTRKMLQYTEQQRIVDQLNSAHHIQVLQDQLQAAQQAATAAQEAAELARAAERQAVAAAAGAGLAIFRGTVTGLTPPSRPTLQPFAALSAIHSVLQAMRTCNVALLVNHLSDELAMAISNIPWLNYVENPTVDGQPANKLRARKETIAMALILSSHMAPHEARTISEFLLNGFLTDGPSRFATACSRMKRRQDECTAELYPIYESVFGNNDGFNNRKNAAFLMVGLLLQHVL